jgi:hypothetical protein
VDISEEYDENDYELIDEETVVLPPVNCAVFLRAYFGQIKALGLSSSVCYPFRERL